MKQYLVSLDQGTTSSRAIIFDRNQNIISMAQQEFAQHYPKAGYVEHDPMDIYASQISVLTEALLKGGVSILSQKKIISIKGRKFSKICYRGLKIGKIKF